MSAQRRPATKRDATATAAPRRRSAGATRSPQPAVAAAERPTPEHPAVDRPKPTAAARQAPAPARRGLAERTERIRKLYRDTAAEIKRVNWPDQETTRNLTIVVIGISVVLGILLGGIDFVLLRLLELF